MGKKIKPMRVAGSNFDRNEKFGLANVPKHFDSVTDDEIERLKKLVMDEVGEASQFKPGALSDILKSVDGHFDSAYSTLEGDYGTRLANLHEVYTRGMTKLIHACDAFELQAAEYNILLEKYSDASMVIDGKELPKDLSIADEKIAEIKQAVKDLDKRSRKNG